MKKLKLIVLLFFISCLRLDAAQQIKQDNVGNDDFQENIISKAYDRYTGKFYVGTNAVNIGSDATRRIAVAGREGGYFTGLSTLAGAGGAQGIINQISLVSTSGTEATHIPFERNATNELRVLKLSDNSVPATLTKLRGDAASGNICDANGDAAGNPPGVPVFSKIASGYSSTYGNGYIFLRVNSSNGVGVTNSGVLAFKIDGDNLIKVGLANGRAAELDDLEIVSGFLRLRSNSGFLATPPVVNDMYWDEELETLFICGSVTTVNAADRHSAIVKVKLAAPVAPAVDPTLEISAVLPDNVDAADGDDTTIFSTYCNAARRDPRILKIRTMKTSTGKSYLIVNGGIGDSDTDIGNKIYALRYDDTDGHVVANDAGRNGRGTVLVDSFRGYVFNQSAQSLSGTNINSLVVAGEDAPWNNFGTRKASDMQIIGDTVYISFNSRDRNIDNDPGVWSSTAMFDDNGVIIGWTKWERVFPSDNNNASDRAAFFSVDAKSNMVWQVNNPNATVVRRSEIKTTGFVDNTLQARLNSDVPDGCSCVLDLPKNTPGVSRPGGGWPNTSISVLGGIEKAVFAITKVGSTNSVVDFINEGNLYYLSTDLSGAGVVRCLGHSRSPFNGVNTRGYFFAGTDKGLYVFASTATSVGYSTAGAAEGIRNINFEPLDGTFSWQHMAANLITGPVTAIESDGTNLYVVEQDATSEGSITSKLHKFVLADNIGTMVGAANYDLIAQSGSGDLPTNAIFTGFKLTTGRRGQNARAGILSTNEGIYRSAADLTAVTLATDWNVIDNTKAYNYLFGPKRTPEGADIAARRDGNCNKVIGVALANDSSNRDYYQNSSFYQFNTNAARTLTNDLTDAKYTNADLTGGATALTYLDRTTSFWSDGARRLYTRFNANDTDYSTLHSFPYYAAEWNMTEPYSFADLSSIPRIYWVENISGLGVVLAGTDSGVISLSE